MHTGAVSVGVWTWLAVVYDKSKGKISHYVNGKLIDYQNNQGTRGVGLATSNSHLLIGSHQTYGFLDELMIFNNALVGAPPVERLNLKPQTK